MTEELSNLLKDMAKQVVRERRKQKLSSEAVDSHLLQCIIDYFSKENEKYIQRKENYIDFTQVSNVFNYVTTMRWLKNHTDQETIIISQINIDKVVQKYNFPPSCVQKLQTYSKLQDDSSYIRWIPFLSLAISLASENIYQSVKHAIQLYSLDGIVINIPDLKQVIMYYRSLDEERREQLDLLCKQIEEQSNEDNETEVRVDSILSSEPMKLLALPLNKKNPS